MSWSFLPQREQRIFTYATSDNQPDWQEQVGEGIPRWKKDFQWSRHRAVKRGLVEPAQNVPFGVWKLTAKGWNYNENA